MSSGGTKSEDFAPEPGPGLFPELPPGTPESRADAMVSVCRALYACALQDAIRMTQADSTNGDPEAPDFLAEYEQALAALNAGRESNPALDRLRGILQQAPEPQTLAEASEAMLPALDEPPGKLAHVEVKGFRDLGVVRVSESTLGGVAMLRAVDADGAVAEFPASSLHFITWLPEGATEADVRRALPAGAAHDVHDGFGDRDGWDGEGPW